MTIPNKVWDLRFALLSINKNVEKHPVIKAVFKCYFLAPNEVLK